jgi:hypothetical protein
MHFGDYSLAVEVDNLHGRSISAGAASGCRCLELSHRTDFLLTLESRRFIPAYVRRESPCRERGEIMPLSVMRGSQPATRIWPLRMPS